jgi:hypothetical protein
MKAGIDFPSFFDEDLFSLRHSGTAFAAGNPYDPESLISGAEVEQGFTYSNSRREWADETAYQRAVRGDMPTAEILATAPRQFFTPGPTRYTGGELA